MAPLDGSAKEQKVDDPYLQAWSSISRSMEEGVSWSGHEHNVAWLNAGDGTFVEASGPLGFDQVADGRVVCKTDWDRDGDIDLWLRSRNGVALRYLENQSNPRSFVEISGLGTRTSLAVEAPSSDEDSASGASGAFDLGSRMLAAAMTDGYLSAPSRRVVAALPEGTAADRGLGRLDGALLPRAIQGSPVKRVRFVGEDLVDNSLDFEPRPTLKVDGEPPHGTLEQGALEQGPLPTRTVLRSGVPFPPQRLEELGVPFESEPKRRAARLLVVRSSDCPTCEAVLPDALAVLRDAGSAVDVVSFPVSLDLESRDGDRSETAAVVRSIVASLLGPGAELALPLSILFDAQGVAQVIYQADLDPATLSQDAKHFVLDPVQGAFRGSWGEPGAGSRWFHGSPRSFASLRESLVSQGLQGDADFFAANGRSKR